MWRDTCNGLFRGQKLKDRIITVAVPVPRLDFLMAVPESLDRRPIQVDLQLRPVRRPTPSRTSLINGHLTRQKFCQKQTAAEFYETSMTPTITNDRLSLSHQALTTVLLVGFNSDDAPESDRRRRSCRECRRIKVDMTSSLQERSSEVIYPGDDNNQDSDLIPKMCYRLMMYCRQLHVRYLSEFKQRS
jgi:hypothetical protein